MELAAIAAVLGAMGGIIKLILDHLTRQREGFEKFMGNHISHMSHAIEDNSKAIEANTLVLRAIARRAEVRITGAAPKEGDDV